MEMQDIVKQLARAGQLPQRPIFMPLIFAAAAKVSGLTPREFFTNPTKISNGLRQLQAPLHCDALVCYADKTLIAEAMGAQVSWERGLAEIIAPPQNSASNDISKNEIAKCGRVPIVREVVSRLRGLLRERVALSVALPDLATTAAYFSDANALEHAGDATIQVVRAVCEQGADVIFFLETDIPKGELLSAQWLEWNESIFNVIRFYEALPVMHTAPNLAQEISARGALPCLTPRDWESANVSPYGIALAVNDAVETGNWRQPQCALVTTDGEIPYEMDAKELRGVVGRLWEVANGLPTDRKAAMNTSP